MLCSNTCVRCRYSVHFLTYAINVANYVSIAEVRCDHGDVGSDSSRVVHKTFMTGHSL